MKAYIAGPMTGIPRFNFPAFDEAASYLRDQGWEVVSPAELDDPETRKAALASTDGAPGTGSNSGETWGDFLARDVKLIADGGIQVIVCLPGWENSKGARLETFVGRLAGLTILDYETLEEVSPELIEAAHGYRFQAVPELRQQDPTGFLPGSQPARSPRVSFPTAEYVARGYAVSDEVRVTDPETGGAKGQKQPQLGALDPDAILQVARVAGFGATKYERLNYLRGFDWSLAFDALMRHSLEFWAGREIDDESGLPHMAHAAWQCMCLLSFASRDLGTDDRVSAGLHLMRGEAA